MAATVHEIDRKRKAGAKPLVGALLRRPFMAARRQIVDQLHAAGFTEILPAHLAVFQHPGPHGRAPSDIARSANASKQAINNLLAQLERTGYLTRAIHPANRRERRVELTSRGEAAITAIRGAVDQIEARWRADLGVAQYQRLRSLLERLNEALEEEDY